MSTSVRFHDAEDLLASNLMTNFVDCFF